MIDKKKKCIPTTIIILIVGFATYVLWDWYQYKSSRLLYYPKNDCVESPKYKHIPLESGWGVYVCKKGDVIKTEILMDPDKLKEVK